MKNDIRNPGIGFIENIPWGKHLCQFSIKEDFVDVIMSYFKNKAENYD
jgi:hypothetical protein